MLLTKETPQVEPEHIEPPDADLALIQQYAKREVKAGDVYCFALHTCNTKVDRAGERFTKAYLERFKETLPGKPLIEGHDYSRRPLGRIYKTEVLPDGQDWFLKSYAYLKADSPVVDEIELGIANSCSVGYSAHKRTCDLCSKEWHPQRRGGDYCSHRPLQDYDGKTCTIAYCDSAVQKAEGREISLVYLGCQYGAEAMGKSASPGWFEEWIKGIVVSGGGVWPQPVIGDPTMTKTLEEVQAELLQAKALHQSEMEQLRKEMAQKSALSAEGEAYRSYLKAEIKRMADVIETTEPGTAAQYATFLELLKDASVEQIMPTYERVKNAFDEKFSKGQAHTGGPQDDTQPTNQKMPWERRLRRVA
jgi:hypothetical protein